MNRVILLSMVGIGFMGMIIESVSANHDSCNIEGQSCTCSNTGWDGACGYGNLKMGLYCQCWEPDDHF